MLSTLARCDLFVIVVDKGWDFSTWMGSEADLAQRQICDTCLFWNPTNVAARGMLQYLREELPPQLDQAIVAIVGRSAG